MHKYAKVKQKDTIYSAAEMVAVRKLNKAKIFFLHPLVTFLDKIKVTPNMVSVFSAVTVVVAFIFSYLFVNPIYFVIGIWLHLILDSIDGTLARYQKTNSSTGAVVDSVCDHFGVVSASAFTYLFMIVDGVNMLIFVILYSLLMAIILYLLKNKSSYAFVLRPRLYLYIAMTIDVFWLIHITHYIVLIASMIMLVEVILGIIKILSIKSSAH